MNIYFDESGNTGQDLLNKDQPFFVLASNNYSSEELLTLSSLFEENEELHFQKLKNSESGRRGILKFINHPLICEKNINIVVADKMAVAAGQIVDRLIEPIYLDNGLDIYEEKQNMLLNSFLHVFGNNFWDKQLYEGFLLSFVKMFRVRDSDSIEEFYKNTEKLFQSPKTKQKDILIPVLKSKEQIIEILESLDKYSLDITLSSFLVLCNLWYDKLGHKLTVLHDNSKQIEFYEYLIDKLTNSGVLTKVVNIGTQSVTLPYQVKSLSLVDSKKYLGIQISDLIASAISFSFNNKKVKQEPFVEEIKKSKLVNLTNYFLLKSYNVEELKTHGVNFELAHRNIKLFT